MKKLNSLPEIVFVDADANVVEELIIAEYEKISGRHLAMGDPIRLFLLTIANIVILLKNDINMTGKQNLLRFATGTNLDHIGALVGLERTPAASAFTTIKVRLSEQMESNVTVPAGTRFTAGDNVFFSLDETMVIVSGELEGSGQATCLEEGDIGNSYMPGQIKTLVDPVPYVSSVTNITKSEGGANRESDDDYRESIHNAPESFSVAGPKGAYEFYAKQASTLIEDVAVWSPTPGCVEVRPLLIGGEIPGQEIIELVEESLNDKRIRPLTDKLTVAAPVKKLYNVNITYYIDNDDKALSNQIQDNVNSVISEWVLWQKSKLGRDINPSKLIRMVEEAGAKRIEVNSPGFSKVDVTEVAIANSIAVNFGGFEDG